VLDSGRTEEFVQVLLQTSNIFGFEMIRTDGEAAMRARKSSGTLMVNFCPEMFDR
jgi:hypothetical protein